MQLFIAIIVLCVSALLLYVKTNKFTVWKKKFRVWNKQRKKEAERKRIIESRGGTYVPPCKCSVCRRLGPDHHGVVIH